MNDFDKGFILTANQYKTTAMYTRLFKPVITSGFAFFFLFSCFAQVPSVQPINKLPEGAKLTLKKDTTPVRFAVGFRETILNASPGQVPLMKRYNLNESAVSIGESSITINKTGLYHFDYYIQAAALSSKTPVITTYLSGVFPSSSFTFIKDDAIEASAHDGVYRRNWNFSVDIYIKAPAALKLMRYVIGATSSTGIEGNFLGHLISE